MTAGNGSTNFHDYVTLFGLTAGVETYNGGVGGQTSTQIAARETVDTAHQSWPTIICAGRNNYTDPTTVKADIASMVAHLTTSNYLVLSILNGEFTNEYKGQPDYNTIIQLNADLAATYGGHYLDVRSYLVSLYDPNQPQDVIDFGNDVPPTSLRFDSIHLNDAGYADLVNYIYAHRAELGLN